VTKYKKITGNEKKKLRVQQIGKNTILSIIFNVKTKIMNTKLKIFIVLIICGLSVQSFGQIKLPSIFSDNMVLQQNSEATIWGWGDPGSEIRISKSWSKDTVEARISNQSAWKVKLKTPAAVRFSFSNDAIGNLFSREGLPVAPFRTDNWKY
jgi:hypothetical protein